MKLFLHVGPRDVYCKKDRGNGIWTVNAKAKRGAEVILRDLSPGENEEFDMAKGKEIDSYIEHVAVDIYNLHGVDKDRILGMRWVLVWKPITDESGTLTGRKAKARLIIKGFQDPDLLHISRDSPTLSTLGRNLLLSLTSHFGMGTVSR